MNQHATGAAYDVVISYRPDEREFVAALARRLEARGVACWYDPALGAGAAAQNAANMLAGARIGVVVFAAESNRTSEPIELARAADAQAKALVLLLMENAEPRGALLAALAHRPWIKVYPDPGAHLEQLADLMARLAGKGDGAGATSSAAESLEDRERQADAALGDMLHRAVDPSIGVSADPAAYIRAKGSGRASAIAGVLNVLSLGVSGALARRRAIRVFRSNIRTL